MLLDITFQNFRSFKNPGLLSLIASKSVKEHASALITPELPGMSKVQVLRMAAIYGANASGKSNVARALYELQHLVRNSHKTERNEPIDLHPFALDDSSVNEPSLCMIRFVSSGVRYHYSIALNSKRILEERLEAYPKGKPQLWYHRLWEEQSNRYDYETGTDFDLRRQDTDSTKPNSLLLSTAANVLNHPQLGAVYDFFRSDLVVKNLATDGNGFGMDATIAAINNNPKWVADLLRNADLGIRSARLQSYRPSMEEVIHLPPEYRKQFEDKDIIEPRLGHAGANSEIYELDFRNESEGTRRFLEMIVPWLWAIKRGSVLVVDEIETSLHPVLVRNLVELFLNPEINSKNAQLIVATHDPLLLDKALLRRDQIWLTEKTNEGCSMLYSLNEYETPPNNRESIQRGYLAGRYGGIPFIPSSLLNSPPEAFTGSSNAEKSKKRGLFQQDFKMPLWNDLMRGGSQRRPC